MRFVGVMAMSCAKQFAMIAALRPSVTRNVFMKGCINSFVLVLVLLLVLVLDYEKEHEDEEELKANHGFNGSI